MFFLVRIASIYLMLYLLELDVSAPCLVLGKLKIASILANAKKWWFAMLKTMLWALFCLICVAGGSACFYPSDVGRNLMS